MNPTERLLATSDRELLPAFLAMCGDVAGTQEEVLLGILGAARESEWGRVHGFGGIRSVADYRERQAVTEWADYVPLALRLERGEKDLLFEGRPALFLQTSGTEGARKLLPESARGLDAKTVTGKLRLASLLRCFPELAREGAILPLANRPEIGRTAAGIQVGTASGSTLENLSGPLTGRLAFPLELLKAEEQETLDYLILRFSLERDVRVVVGNNAGRLTSLLEMADRRREELIRDVAEGTVSRHVPLDPALAAALPLTPNPERAKALHAWVAASGHLLPRDYWPSLRVVAFWLSGSVGRYLAELEPWLPAGVARMDVGYGASEAKINVPLTPGRAAGPLALHGQLFEFVPVDGGPALLAHELEEGGRYRLLVTTWSGLYRYDLHDVVRVEGFTSGCPDVVFEGKAGDVGNITGEKLAGPIVVRIASAVFAEAGIRPRHWCAATDLERHGYDVCLELSSGSAPVERDLPARLDEALTGEVFTYRLMREQGMLRPLRLHLMAEGWLERLQASKPGPGVSLNQVKLPVVVPLVPLPEMVERTIDQEV